MTHKSPPGSGSSHEDFPTLSPGEALEAMKRLVEMTPAPSAEQLASSRVPHALDLAVWEHVHSDWSTPSLADWLYTSMPPASDSTIQLSPELRAMGSTIPSIGSRLDGSTQEDAFEYAVGEIIELDVRTPDALPMYITILLQRGELPLLLAYPYDRSDLYQPMQRLELKWKVEEGPNPRRFYVLFSQGPLLPTHLIPDDKEPGWNLQAAQNAAQAIVPEHVSSGYQVRWNKS